MYKKSDGEKTADKLVKLFADGRILPYQWKFQIPEYLVMDSFNVLRNVKNFADGVNFYSELHNRVIPSEKLVGDFPTVKDVNPVEIFEYEKNLFLEQEYGPRRNAAKNRRK
jgi:hypothetical protein